MLLLGIDLGTSSIKVSVIDASNSSVLATAQYPETEAAIISHQPGWAEQSPNQWWNDVKAAILKLQATGSFKSSDIGAIGIAYQMHGLVLVDNHQNVIRDSIIWCDNRAVGLGEKAFEQLGSDYCLGHLLNTPGNFTASKLAWVKQNEPERYAQIHKMMLPGDFISMKLTGEITTTIAALSEGMFWDFKNKTVAAAVMEYYGLDAQHIPVIKNVFDTHGYLTENVAQEIGLPKGIPVTYKAGDQQNNALSLNVLNPGEVAATAGTSAVIYAVSDSLQSDTASRVNSFAHVNHTLEQNSIGVLLCINGAGISNSWIKNKVGASSYYEMNELAATVAPGSDGVSVLPFGNGSERMLHNKNIGAHILGLDFNRHGAAHLYRAVQEGVVFAMQYGFKVLQQNGVQPSIIRAGKANMFLSEVFLGAFVNTLQVPVELFQTDGSAGAAIGAGYGAKVYATIEEAFVNSKPLQIIEPSGNNAYAPAYANWEDQLALQIKNNQ
jgi:xylulokinase